MIILDRKPNDRCRCDSGKKFKKCCMNIEYDDLKNITLLDEDFPEEAYKDNREILSEEDARFIYLPHFFIQNPDRFSATQVTEIGEQLLVCKQRYPNNPTILNFLYNFHVVQNEQEQALYYLDEIEHRFPRYLFGRVMCAQRAINQRKIDEALGYLKHSNSLNELDQTRSLFHISEAAAFHSMLIECYARKGDEALVSRHYKNLTKIVSMSPGRKCDSYIRSARETILFWNTAYLSVLGEMLSEKRLEQPFEKPQETQTLVE